jgi:hypothetical protein
MTTISIASVRIDGGTQSRVAMNDAVVSEYAAMLDADANFNFPAIVVFDDGEFHWLADGFHRLAAHKRAGRSQIEVEVREGDQRDAIMFSLTANAAHGLPRTNADKRKAVRIVLDDPEWSKQSDREIARQCAVSNDFVSRMRRGVSSDDSGARREAIATLKRKGKPLPAAVASEFRTETFASIEEEAESVIEFIRPRIAPASLGAMTEAIAFIKRQADIFHGAVL